MSIPLIESYHDARADAYAGVEDVVESLKEQRIERMKELLNNPDERDPEVWAEYFEFYELDDEGFIDDPIDYMNAFALHERDKGWHDTVTAMVDAADAQSWADVVMLPWLREAQQGAVQSHESLAKLSSVEVRKIGRTGLARFDAAKKKRSDARSSD